MLISILGEVFGEMKIEEKIGGGGVQAFIRQVRASLPNVAFIAEFRNDKPISGAY